MTAELEFKLSLEAVLGAAEETRHRPDQSSALLRSIRDELRPERRILCRALFELARRARPASTLILGSPSGAEELHLIEGAAPGTVLVYERPGEQRLGENGTSFPNVVTLDGPDSTSPGVLEEVRLKYPDLAYLRLTGTYGRGRTEIETYAELLPPGALILLQFTRDLEPLWVSLPFSKARLEGSFWAVAGVGSKRRNSTLRFGAVVVPRRDP